MLTQSPLIFFFLVLLASLVAGFGGSLIGLGGAILMTPILTIFFGVPIRLAIGASVVSIIATSSGAAAAYVRDHITNLRVGMSMEVAMIETIEAPMARRISTPKKIVKIGVMRMPPPIPISEPPKPASNEASRTSAKKTNGESVGIRYAPPLPSRTLTSRISSTSVVMPT